MTSRSSLVAIAVGLALSVAACGGGSGDDKVTAPTDGTVTIEAFTFKPDTITVPAGTTVTWTNKDTFAHSVKPVDDRFPVSPDIGVATPFRHTYDRAGRYTYLCGIHNSMTGVVVVT